MRICMMMLMLWVISVPFGSAHALSLHSKADLFQKDMESRFLLDGQALCKLKLPTNARDFIAYNMPDNAYMTGIYTGTLAMKYAVTGDENDRQAALQSLDALHLLCNVSGTPGVLARAAWPREEPMDDDGIWRESSCGKYLWRGDVSTDQVAGVMFGFSLAHDLVADEAGKKRIGRDASAMVDHVVANDMRIVDVDGEPTVWGRYDPEYVLQRERLNSLLWLQAVTVACQTTGDERYATLYRKWAEDEKYAKLALNARRMLLPNIRGFVNHSDDVLLFLGYIPLLMMERDTVLRDFYLRSLRRTWDGEGRFPGVKPEQNPFYAFAVGKFLDDHSGVQGGINTLRWFPLDMKWNRETLNRYKERFTFSFDTRPESPEPEPGQAVPVDRREKTWSAWVQDPYHSAGGRSADSGMEFNGHDYLLGYWMGRYYGFINASE